MIRNPSKVLILDEGVLQGYVQEMDFIGSGVTATIVGNRAAIAVSAGGGSAEIKTTEIDFGPIPVSEKIFSIADATVSAGQQVVILQSYDAATGRQADENEFANTNLIAGQVVAGVGFQLLARTVNGYKELQGLFKVNYLLG